ncbi:MAG TPA: chemotaxis protein CheA, partial [Anaerolineales bacterium]|nr:chemotaxis protein CheA [Anaerolineales bacterium]
MEIIFDINKDELPIFLAEVDEHLQVLDNNLIRLQKESDHSELVQTVFRSAHTIKGMAGMIGHRRMTDVTHALENVLDGVRKSSIEITAQLINLCLQAVDCLRSLRDEVATSQVSAVDIQEVVSSLKGLVEQREKKAGRVKKVSKRSARVVPVVSDSPNGILHIHARIDTHSMASTARAFQMMLALQDVGEIRSMTPTQEQIESATSVSDFTAELLPNQPLEKISAVLTQISGILEISIDGVIVCRDGEAVVESSPQAAAKESSPSRDMEANPAAREMRSESMGKRISDLTFRMNVEHMDRLMNLVGELIIDRNHLKQIHGHLARLNNSYDQISEAVTHLGQIADQLQEEVMSMRMLPIGNTFNKFPRMIHDMSQRVNKQINVVIRGEETEMDRMMIEEISDPLIHLVRNSVDHGIEAPAERLALGKPEYGTITMTARHEQGRIMLTVEDDGGGIDGEKLRNKAIQKGLISPEEAAGLTEQQAVELMFLPGLSTAAQATEFSGRGVGL